ncbi:MAG: hypothetical protein ABI412_05820 [Sphingomicrobium sp.]
MRKFMISAAVAVSATAMAAPAAAQYAPVRPAPGYNHNNYGQVRVLQARVDRAQREIRNLDRRNILSNREARSLNREASSLEYRLRMLARNGLNWNESRDINNRIVRLERNIYRQATDGNRRLGYGNYRYPDRDRDGRDDRYEDDRGTRHDRH